MLVKKCLAPDLPESTKNNPLHGKYIAMSLTGNITYETITEKRCTLALIRLIMKAKNDYLEARQAMIDEENEGLLTYKEIQKRNEGQYLYVYSIIDNLENCITTLYRIYAILKRYFEGLTMNNDIRQLRNSIEHIETRIREESDEYPFLNVSEDATFLEVAGSEKGKRIKISTEIIAESITFLDKEINNILYKKPDSLIRYKKIETS